MKAFSFTFLRQVWIHLIRPYWTSEEKWIAMSLLGSHLALMGLFISLSVWLNYWQNDLYTSIQELNSSAFFSLLGQFCIIAFFAIIAFMLKSYLLQKLHIRWRRWLTENFLKNWTKDRRYYALQLKGKGTDNPDQRIAEDIIQFITNSLTLSIGLLQEVIMLISFLGILWGLSGTLHIPLGSFSVSIPGYMCLGAILYAIGGTFISIYLGRPLIHLDYEQQKREADFRYSLLRFRENVEGVALYGGEEKEKRIFSSRFSPIVDNFNAVLKRMLKIHAWSSLYGQIDGIYPTLLAAPRLFAKEITFGGFMQTITAFKQVSHSLSFIITNYPSIASWCATTNRLLEFKLNLETLPPCPLSHSTHEHEVVHIACDHIALPHGAILNEDLHFSFIKGEDTLITGRTGVGKSTLARVIAGLWPYGKGDVKRPSSPFLFLPQKPYMPLGTLEDVLQYPASHASPEDIENALEDVGLGHFMSSLQETNDWARILSLGEQQRIAIARTLLTKPHWLVLDEATSAMDEASEAHLYRLLKEKLPETTFISIGHRESLKLFHTREICLEEAFSQNRVAA
ncbi:MAG: ABC transporter ATP-binding protein/permease [Alphaproteobacteria bacterium]|nr:ABC transporter ATP-binding protein/permease [Alphaproteobacteria bacterium]